MITEDKMIENCGLIIQEWCEDQNICLKELANAMDTPYELISEIVDDNLAISPTDDIVWDFYELTGIDLADTNNACCH